jgi:hypothetical protein
MLTRPRVGVNGVTRTPVSFNARPGRLAYKVSAKSRTSAPGVRIECVERSP